MILAILQARTSSSRFPRKVLEPLLGKPMILRQIERIRRAKRLDALVLATSVDASDDELAQVCAEAGVKVYRGPLDDVLGRFIGAAQSAAAPDWVVRLTGDCPLTDPAVIDCVIEQAVQSNADYASNAVEATFPDGLDVEVMRAAALAALSAEPRSDAEREHVTLALYRRPERFKIHHVRNDRDLSHLRWTVDEPRDFVLVKAIYEALYPAKPDFGSADILALIEKRRELATLNVDIKRNEGLAKSLAAEQSPLPRFAGRRELRRRPICPSAIESRKNSSPVRSARFRSAARPSPSRRLSTLSASRPISSSAVRAAMSGTSTATNMSTSSTVCWPSRWAMATRTSPLRSRRNSKTASSFHSPTRSRPTSPSASSIWRHARRWCASARMGRTRTAGAVRLARAYTKRDRVAVCGYHGWQDWYIGSTARWLGVPQATRDLTHAFVYNDLASVEALLKAHPDEFAAVILEPMNVAEPAPGFLEGLKELTHRHGALLIFDETITGFRFANGGAQELFGVTPDLATYGKGLANGYPLSAVVGRAEIMNLMEEIFFSFTLGGETLSLAAAKATLDKLRREPVLATIDSRGRTVVDGAAAIVAENQLGDFLSLAGRPCWSFLIIKDTPDYSSYEIKTLFLQEMLARGILTLGTHNMSYAHSEEDIESLLAAYREVIPILGEAVRHRALKQLLKCEPLQPLFKVR